VTDYEQTRRTALLNSGHTPPSHCGNVHPRKTRSVMTANNIG
jgi:hypothetical protein